MIYYGNPSTEAIRSAMTDGLLGCIITQRQGNTPEPGWDVIADNGCFSDRWTREGWESWLPTVDRPSTRFAVVPDVVGDHRATLERWLEFSPWVRSLGFQPAFVLQDGCTESEVPRDAEFLFIGGSTEWKLSPCARDITMSAVAEGRWVHMGRVNSLKRLRIAASWGVSSVDGTYLTFGPDVNLPTLLSWLRALEWVDAPLFPDLA